MRLFYTVDTHSTSSDKGAVACCCGQWRVLWQVSTAPSTWCSRPRHHATARLSCGVEGIPGRQRSITMVRFHLNLEFSPPYATLRSLGNGGCHSPQYMLRAYETSYRVKSLLIFGTNSANITSIRKLCFALNSRWCYHRKVSVKRRDLFVEPLVWLSLQQ